jgi:hypothetical protein
MLPITSWEEFRSAIFQKKKENVKKFFSGTLGIVAGTLGESGSAKLYFPGVLGSWACYQLHLEKSSAQLFSKKRRKMSRFFFSGTSVIVAGTFGNRGVLNYIPLGIKGINKCSRNSLLFPYCFSENLLLFPHLILYCFQKISRKLPIFGDLRKSGGDFGGIGER